jgi:hypothetical protein
LLFDLMVAVVLWYGEGISQKLTYQEIQRLGIGKNTFCNLRQRAKL